MNISLWTYLLNIKNIPLHFSENKKNNYIIPFPLGNGLKCCWLRAMHNVNSDMHG